MRERQLVRVQYMSTFHGTNGMSIKSPYTEAVSPVGPEMLSGDAALLFQPYSGCTGNILSFYPSTSPRSISDPLTITDSPQVCLLRFSLFSTSIFFYLAHKGSHPNLLLSLISSFLPQPFMDFPFLIFFIS